MKFKILVAIALIASGVHAQAAALDQDVSNLAGAQARFIVHDADGYHLLTDDQRFGKQPSMQEQLDQGAVWYLHSYLGKKASEQVAYFDGSKWVSQ